MSRLYTEAGEVLEQVLLRKGSVRSIVFSEESRITNQKACYGFVSSVLKHVGALEKVVEMLQKECPELFPEPENPELPISKRRALVMVMVYDLAFSRSQHICGGGALKRLILTKEDKIREMLKADVKKQSAADEETPMESGSCSNGGMCYARVNTIKGSVQDAIKELMDTGKFEKVVADRDMPSCVIEITAKQGENAMSRLKETKAVAERRVIIQSKPSCMPPVVLAPEEGSRVIDACAAPGNKTSLLAAIMANKGTVIAFDRDRKRLEVMKGLLAASGVTNVDAQHKDFLTSDPSDPQYSNIDYILLDPSCSGSGLLDRPDTERTGKDSKRVATLSHFQLQMLRHAMTFGAKRVVYSTCSIHKEEDEGVVMRALEGSNYHLEKALPTWKRRGDKSAFRGAEKCVRVDPVEDGITGFFVALFVRNDLGEGAGKDGRYGGTTKKGKGKREREQRKEKGKKGKGANDDSPVPAKKAKESEPEKSVAEDNAATNETPAPEEKQEKVEEPEPVKTEPVSAEPVNADEASEISEKKKKRKEKKEKKRPKITKFDDDEDGDVEMPAPEEKQEKVEEPEPEKIEPVKAEETSEVSEKKKKRKEKKEKKRPKITKFDDDEE